MILAVKVDLLYLRQGHSNGGDRTHCGCVTPLLRGTGCDQRERRLESAVHKVSAHDPVIHVSSRERSGPHPLNGSWDSRESAPQTVSRSVHAFEQGQTQTNSKQTAHEPRCVQYVLLLLDCRSHLSFLRFMHTA